MSKVNQIFTQEDMQEYQAQLTEVEFLIKTILQGIEKSDEEVDAKEVQFLNTVIDTTKELFTKVKGVDPVPNKDAIAIMAHMNLINTLLENMVSDMEGDDEDEDFDDEDFDDEDFEDEDFDDEDFDDEETEEDEPKDSHTHDGKGCCNHKIHKHPNS